MTPRRTRRNSSSALGSALKIGRRNGEVGRPKNKPANGKPHKILCFLPIAEAWRALSGKIFHPCERADALFREEISPMQACRRGFLGKNLTHAGGPARSFGKKTHLCEMAGAHFRGSNLTHARGRIQSSGKKSHAYRWICASFRGRNLTLADGWRALSGMILPLFERGRRMCPRFLGFCNRRADLFCAAL